MSVKLEAGQWYRTRGGEIWYCIGESKATSDPLDKWVVENRYGQIDTFCIDGSWVENDQNESDIVEHLPDCTGFDWEPPKPEPKYRPFKWEERERLRGKWIQFVSNGALIELACDSFYMVQQFTINGYRSDWLFEHAQFLGGARFGVVDE